MRLTVITACLLLLLLAPVCAAPAPPPPWSAPDRELIDTMVDTKLYILRSSLEICPEGITVDILFDHTSKTSDSGTKYLLETVRIAPFTNRIRVMSSKGYNTKGVLLFDHPPEDWETPGRLTYGRLVPAVIDYFKTIISDIRNIAKVKVNKSSATDVSWYTKVFTNDFGDTYYFHPGMISVGEKNLSAFVRTDFAQEIGGAKFLEAILIVDPAGKRYYFAEGKFFDINGEEIRKIPEEALNSWLAIDPDKAMGKLLISFLEYCRQSYITPSATFDQAVPRLIPFQSPEYSAYFNPDSIVVRDGFLWMEMIRRSTIESYTALEVLRLSDKKWRTAGYHTYDAAGNEKPGRASFGNQSWLWKDIKPRSVEESLFDAVLDYCRENGISLDP